MEGYRVLQKLWLPLAILMACQSMVGTQRPIPDPPGPPSPGRPDPPGPARTTKPPTTMPPFALAPPSEYRLVNAINAPGLGKVEAFYNGTWRPVCSTYRWDDKDAQVLCRSLGYSKGNKASPRSFPPKEEKSDEEEPGTPGRRIPPPRPVDEGPSIGIIRPTPSQPPPVVKLNLDFNCVGDESRLDECPGQWVSRCYTDVAAICFTGQSSEKKIDGIRLVSPKDQPPTSLMAIGKVEVLHRGFWGTVCTRSNNRGSNRGSNFRETEATSVCQALGYRSGTHVYRGSLSLPNQGDPIFWFGQFDCNNMVTRDLGRCSREEELGLLGCSSHYYDAQVLCVNTTETYSQLRVQDVRLSNTTRGKNWVMGRVEVQVAGQWGSVCERRRYSNKDWTDPNARALCRQQGYPHGISVTASVFGSKKQPVFLFNRKCPSDAGHINACPSASTYQEYDCTTGGAGVFCTTAEDDCVLKAPPTSPTRSPVRPPPPPGGLTPGRIPSLTTRPDLPRPTAGKPPPTTTPPLPEKCRDRLRIVGSPDVEPEMRGKAGRVEYYYEGLWGPVCAVGFDDREAHVICKSLGLKTGRAMMNSSFGEGDGPNWLSHLRCAGNEDNLNACLNRRGSRVLNYPSCPKKHQAGVVCEGDGEAEKVAVRLTNKNIRKGDEVYNGVVEVLYKGHWGTICSNDWDDKDASVICREMGYATGFATSNNTKGIGTMPVWLEGVNCQGNEKSIMDCQHSGWAEKSMFALCDHSNDAGALCIEGKKPNKDKGKEQNTNNVLSNTAKASSDNAGSRNVLSSYLAVFLIITSSFVMAK